MDNFTPFSALIGGSMIGLSAALLLATEGRILGISGVLGGALTRLGPDTGWRLRFLAGLASGGLLLLAAAPSTVDVVLDRSMPVVALAGLLVGFGTRMGNGCTSGHGVCGLSRFSPRSAVATATFMAAGFLSVGVFRALTGGV